MDFTGRTADIFPPRQHTDDSEFLLRYQSFLNAHEISVCKDAEQIDQTRNDVPGDHRSGLNKQAVINPQDLEQSHDCGHPRGDGPSRVTSPIHVATGAETSRIRGQIAYK